VLSLATPVAAGAAPLPQGVVVQIEAGSPITKTKFTHWLHVIAVQHDARRAPRPGEKQYRPWRDMALQFLISARWVQGEARERHITISDARVRREFRHNRKANFKSDKAFRRFLRDSGETVDDLLFRTRLDLLNNAVLQALSDDELAAFPEKWRARTSCAPGYVIKDYCGPAPAP
jgi:hypothetical protein